MTRKMPRPYHAAPQTAPQPMQAPLLPDPMRSSDVLPMRTADEPSSHPPPQEPSPQSSFDPSKYCKPFCSFMTSNPTTYHAVNAFAEELTSNGYTKLSERDLWTDKLKRGGKYFFERNGSSIIAFSIGDRYEAGNGAAVVAAHVDALSARVKPISTKPTKQGFVQLGVAQYGGALNQTWFDRDLSIGGRVFIKDNKTGAIQRKLVKLDWPIARIPTIAPHFGIRAEGQANRETRMIPIIGLDNSDLVMKQEDMTAPPLRGAGGVFATSQPERLIKAISNEVGLDDYTNIVNWELEMYDSQAAQVGGLDKEFIFAARVDDRLCSFAAIEGLLASSPSDSGIIKMAALFDDEEVGSLLRQGARGNMLPACMERICESFASSGSCAGILHQNYANSFLISADVCHAYNPNYDDVYLKDHTPRLNVGVAVTYDSNAHMTTDGTSFSLLSEIAQKCDSVLQMFQIRNDSRSGGTVGPMLSAATGMRAVDAGCPQLSMHSIRATTGTLDPGLGVQLFKGFYDHFEEVDKQFQ